MLNPSQEKKEKVADKAIRKRKTQEETKTTKGKGAEPKKRGRPPKDSKTPECLVTPVKSKSGKGKGRSWKLSLVAKKTAADHRLSTAREALEELISGMRLKAGSGQAFEYGFKAPEKGFDRKFLSYV